jgi:hypothetical protein
MSKHICAAWRATSIVFGVALLLSVVGWASLQQVAHAATAEPHATQALITVDTTDPAINDDGLCSLIEAIENANADALIHDDCAIGIDTDTISLPVDSLITFSTTHNSEGGPNALPVISTTITIEGNGAELVRDTSGPLFRFFNVAPGGSLTINNLGMRNGRAGLTGTTQLLYGGGAIVSQGTLVIRNSNFESNSASFGGAIYSEPITGSLSVENSAFMSNTADFDGGAIYNLGPGEIDNVTLSFNQAGSAGGAIMHDSGELSIIRSTVVDNIATSVGAGIAARAAITNSELSILASDIISNAAGGSGGGLYNSAFNGLTSLVDVDTSSIIGNRAVSTDTAQGLGGGILNGWISDSGSGAAELRVRLSSITDNEAQLGGGIANVDATGYTSRTANVVITQSTLARNSAAGAGDGRGSGGGLYNSNGSAALANTTISGNQALGDDEVLGGRGGGIGSISHGVTTTLQLLNTTIAFNEASQAGGGIAIASQVTTTTATLESGNTLVVSNELVVQESNVLEELLPTIASIRVIAGTESCSIENGAVTSLGGNIEDGNTCDFTGFRDWQGVAVALEPLADNGGTTQTHLIESLGAAFNGGVETVCTSPLVGGVDQRGVNRPQSERCDVGALELVEDTMFFPQMYLRYFFRSGVASE